MSVDTTTVSSGSLESVRDTVGSDAGASTTKTTSSNIITATASEMSSTAGDPLSQEHSDTEQMNRNSSDAGTGQTTVIAAAVAAPTILLCLVLVYLALRKTYSSKHGGAQILSTASHKRVSAAKNKEFQSMREMESIYGAAPPLRSEAAAYDVVREGDLLHGDDYWTAPRPATPCTVVVSDVETDVEAHIYDRVAPLGGNEYEGAHSELK